MTPDRERAIARLEQGDCTVALCHGEHCIADSRRGVAPLLALLDSGRDVTGFAAADRVVGKAAAFLYVRLGVAAVYAPVMSRPAYAVLVAHGIDATYGVLVDAIRNRAGDRFCPMETAVWDISQPDEAETTIRHTLKNLSKNHG